MANRQVLSAAAVLVQRAPAGWTAVQVLGKMSMFGDEWPEDGRAFVRFTRGNVTVVLNLRAAGRGKFDKYERERAWLGCVVDGDTLLDGASYIRRGIDVSCCSLVKAEHADPRCHHYAELDQLLEAQAARCAATEARRATSVPVPGLPYSVQPQWFGETAAKLAAGRSVTLTPHGMGTAHELTKGMPRRFDKRASAELEAKLGVSPITVRTLDWD